MEPKICPHCQGKMVEYRHGLSKGLVRGLAKFAKRGRGTVNLNDCHLTLTERTNFYKLKYWGLVEKASTNERGGEWKMTALGWDFVCGNISLRNRVWSYRGDFVRFDGMRIYIQEVTDGWKYRPDYAREAIPHDPNSPQLGLI